MALGQPAWLYKVEMYLQNSNMQLKILNNGKCLAYKALE